MPTICSASVLDRIHGGGDLEILLAILGSLMRTYDLHSVRYGIIPLPQDSRQPKFLGPVGSFLRRRSILAQHRGSQGSSCISQVDEIEFGASQESMRQRGTNRDMLVPYKKARYCYFSTSSTSLEYPSRRKRLGLCGWAPQPFSARNMYEFLSFHLVGVGVVIATRSAE